MEEQESKRNQQENDNRIECFDSLHVDAEDLAMALEDHSSQALWLLDQENGEVIRLSEEELREDEDESCEDPKYVAIRPMESFESFGIMEDFVNELPDGKPSRALANALRKRKPFRSFKDALLDFPQIRESWFKYHNDRMQEIAQAWLDENVPGARLI